MIAAGTTTGFIPPFVSTVYLVGLLGLVAAFIWSFVSTGWWAALLVLLLYLLAGLVRSRATDINLMVRLKEDGKV